MPYDNSLLPGSADYVHTPSKNAREAYFYPIALGRFFCTEDYLTERSSFDSFLLMLVEKGRCRVTCPAGTAVLSAGSIFLLDCYAWHKYEALSPLTLSWIHFDGVCARPYYEILSSRGLPALCPDHFAEYQRIFQKILQMFAAGSVHEALLSKYLTDLLTYLQLAQSPKKRQLPQSPIETAVSFINSHLQEQLSLNQLAALCSLSPYYFTRLFKKETGYTPHEFLLISRINKAKYELSSTAYSIGEISERCGFGSTSHFCTAFKNHTGLTPAAYRQTGGRI